MTTVLFTLVKIVFIINLLLLGPDHHPVSFLSDPIQSIQIDTFYSLLLLPLLDAFRGCLRYNNRNAALIVLKDNGIGAIEQMYVTL